MDPTFRAQLGAWIESEEVKGAVGEEGQDALVKLLGAVAVKPHLVHVKPTYVDEDQSFHEALDDGSVKVHPKTEKVRRQVVTTCPDCRRELLSRGDVMYCPLLPRTLELADTKAGHQGCVIACGTDGSV